jgi:hypothetical protein
MIKGRIAAQIVPVAGLTDQQGVELFTTQDRLDFGYSLKIWHQKEG